MHYIVSIDERHAIVEVRFTGDMPYHEHVQARREVLELCVAHRIRKILIDGRALKVQPTPTEAFHFAQSWPRQPEESPMLIAGVLPVDAAARTWWWIGEAVSADPGYKTMSFDSIEAARSWLSKA